MSPPLVPGALPTAPPRSIAPLRSATCEADDGRDAMKRVVRCWWGKRVEAVEGRPWCSGSGCQRLDVSLTSEGADCGRERPVGRERRTGESYTMCDEGGQRWAGSTRAAGGPAVGTSDASVRALAGGCSGDLGSPAASRLKRFGFFVNRAGWTTGGGATGMTSVKNGVLVESVAEDATFSAFSTARLISSCHEIILRAAETLVMASASLNRRKASAL